nr:hypothetical protein CFOL_v3_16302 [Ipomoea batatas]
MEKNKVKRPMINLLGRAYRKSSSAKREVRMDKKTSKEVVDVKREAAFEKANIVKALWLEKIGRPFSPLLPPGTVMAAAKTTVTMRAAAIVHEFAVSFIHFSPASFNNLCSSVNTILGVLPSLFRYDKKYGVSKNIGTSWACIWIRLPVFIIPSVTKEIQKGVLASRKMDGEQTTVVVKIEEIRIPANKDISHLNVSMPGSVVKWGLPIDVSGIKRFYLFIISLSQQY